MSKNPKDLVSYFFGKTAKTYDKVVLWATFGKDRYWKKEIIQKIAHADSVLDLACGTGILTRMIGHKFPQSKVVGLDISKEYLDIAILKSLPNTSFVLQDAEKMEFDKKFDCICSSYIPKYCDCEILIKNCIKYLYPEGSIILHDFVYPANILIRILWKFHFLILQLIGYSLPSWKFAFTELPQLIQQSNWILQYQTELEKNGFSVTSQYLTCNSSAILYAKKNTLL